MNRLFLGTAMAATLVGAGSAGAVTVNFDTTTLSTTSVARGERVDSFMVGSTTATVSATNKAGTAAKEAGLYDTTPPGSGNDGDGGDGDLLSPFANVLDPTDERSFGNALIILGPESGGLGLPDDDAGGGVITFSFDAPVFFSGLTVLDVEENDLEVFIDGILFQTLGSANNQFAEIMFAPQVANTLSFKLDGSGALDNFQIAPVPVPAALPLLAFGVGALAVAGRRRRKG